MPEQDGLETCRQLKADKQLADIPVIFVTGLQHQTDEDACWDAGGVDFIQKPFNTNTLRNRVKAHLALKRQADLLRSLAYLDGLTGIYNRRYFDNVLSIQLAQHRRKLSPLAVLMIDIDYFKKYNDTFGHLAGDDALRKVASALKHSVREADMVARYGGEEFALILPGTPLTSAKKLMVRLKDRIAAISHSLENKQLVSVTASIGIASLDGSKHFEYPSNLVKAADLALYAAKNSGRNQIIEWNSSLN